MIVDRARLKEIRKDHGDTQESLGKKLGVSTPAVSKWEQGLTDPTLETLLQICRLYDVSSDFLLGLSADDPLFTKKRRSKLSTESRIALKQFEEYLLYRDTKK